MANRLKYPPEYYKKGYSGFHLLSDEQMRSEYDRLRKWANRSLERIAQSEFADQNFYKQYYGKFEQSASELSERDLIYKLSDVAHYAASSRATYTGAREAQRKAVRTLKSRGYTFVTYRNYGDFARFMELVKAAYGDRLYDSERVVEFYEENKQSREVDNQTLLEDFSVWMGNAGISSKGI